MLSRGVRQRALVQQQRRAFSIGKRFERSTINEARKLEDGARVAVGGWVKSVRKHKSVNFVNVNDGSCLAEMQITLPAATAAGGGDGSSEESSGGASDALGVDIADITVGSSVFVEGVLREVPGGKQKRMELHPDKVDLLGKCDAQVYPLQKKYHSLEFLRENLHLRARTNTFGAVTRVRNALSQGLHAYFQDNDFLQLHSPILTSNDCEGAGEQFRIAKNDGKNEFFGTPTYLTVSGQLHAEMYACALSKVYTFGPTFRAENSNTTRHLAEFWMVEPEMAFAGLEECIASAQGAVQRSIKQVLQACPEDIDFFNKNYDKQISERLQALCEREFARITYTDAIAILQKTGVRFEKNPEWGMDLQTEHERYLAEKYVGGPVFVTDYPAEIKAFYMRKNDPDTEGRETVAGMDLLVPKIGELIGGSVREERFELLEAKMRQLGLVPEEIAEQAESGSGGDLDWYLDLRRFGTVPHAGWGLGFERLVLFATGMDNIRDVIPLPRFPGQCQH